MTATEKCNRIPANIKTDMHTTENSINRRTLEKKKEQQNCLRKKTHQQQSDAHITKGDGGVGDAKSHLRNQSSGFPINAHIQDTQPMLGKLKWNTKTNHNQIVKNGKSERQ